MRISNKTDYALLALFSLVAAQDKGPVSARELADRNKIPRKFLEQILRDMKEQGWIESTTGKHGGYRLARPASQISVGEVVRYFDGLLGPTLCSTIDCRDGQCIHESVCRFRWLFMDIRDYTTRLLDNADLETVYSGGPVVQGKKKPSKKGPSDGAAISA